MLVETIVYVQQACSTGQCPTPAPTMPVKVAQTVGVHPVQVQPVKARKRVRLFGYRLFKGYRSCSPK